MHIADKGPCDGNRSQLTTDTSAPSFVRGDIGEEEADCERATVQIAISPATQRLQQVTALAKRGDKLRAKKVDRIRKDLAQGTYHVDAADVAKAILRSEVSWLSGQKQRTP
ncbi:MAG: flagellar biosynthesis anti-sigma factor FlgM [Candidatus Binatia bacterium]